MFSFRRHGQLDDFSELNTLWIKFNQIHSERWLTRSKGASL